MAKRSEIRLDREQRRRETQRLRDAGLRTTRQRLQLSALLFSRGDRHLTAEELLREAQQAGLKVSFATIYNTLKSFTDHGLLKVVPLAGGRILFDTNTRPHFHLHIEETGELFELPPDPDALLERMKAAQPKGWDQDRLEILAYIRRAAPPEDD